MSPSPGELTDADFEVDDIDHDGPEGYRSEEGKTQYIIFGAVAGVVYFLGQSILPQVIMWTMMPEMFMSGRVVLTSPQLPQAVAWRDQLWIPYIDKMGVKPSATLRAITWEGAEVEGSELNLPEPPSGCVADGERLWCVALGSVSTIDGRSVATSYPTFRLNSPSNPFLREGKLCVLDPDFQGHQRLLTWADGEWSVAGWVLPPSPTALGAPAPTVTTTPNGLVTATAAWGVAPQWHVVPAGDELWVVYADSQGHWRCRGIPLSLHDPQGAVDGPISALEFANELEAPWEKVLGQSLTQGAVIARDDALVHVMTTGAGGLNQNISVNVSPFDGETRLLPMLNVSTVAEIGLVRSPDGVVHLLVETFPTSALQIYDLEGGGFVSGAALAGTGPFAAMTSGMFRVYPIMWGAIVALGLTFVISMHSLMRCYRTRTYSFGHSTVRLASLGRRGVARLIDSLLFSTPTTLLGIWLYWNFDVEEFFTRFSSNFTQSLKEIALMILISAAYGLMVFLFVATTEGLWGWSPGKYLCGIRVVRTTFEPIGILRGLVRQFLLLIDGFFNYLVGVMLIAFLVRQQRLGDLVADAIVVEASSLPSVHRRD
ncbi:MAG: RDD family protein [Planctomycetaceae bacterium]|nr:RDD family protein [Planctomycetaceae bacterium]